MKQNLLERVKTFSFSVFVLVKQIRLSYLNRNIINQLLRSATSIGANYAEALGACSRKDFKNKIFIAKKECHETRYWLELLEEVSDGQKSEFQRIKQEIYELNLIFNKITYTLNINDKKPK